MYNRQKIIARLRRQATGETENFKEQMAVYLKQLGELASAAYYMRSFKADEAAYIAEARKSLGDLITQIQLSCEMLGLDFDVIADEGFTSFRDKMREVARSKSHGT